MGVSGNTFLHFRMEEQYYQELPSEVCQHIDPIKVEVEGVDYSEDELWVKLKSESIKAYKKLKVQEYKLNQINK
jgi:hypothetical protein